MNKSSPGTGFKSREGEVRRLYVEDSLDLIRMFLIPLWVTKYPKSLPDGTPNVHLLGFKFMRYSLSKPKASARFVI
ncbi:hypothetical protein L3X38_005109 [Prunus dulcis]|uniref:Uncharacterized protein n=1 Tax=Prunus dulcis TaxID=3755 RepID=A0AAD5F3X5_PRUDU|nr:hypothetical protein L3X38_005109 [Prunus dulcis]